MTPQSNQSPDRSSELEWSSALEEQRQPTLTLKENDLFLITDRLGNTIGHSAHHNATVTGLFCRDSRFLSRSELQIEGRSPILLSSTADTGYSLSVACTNPPVEGHLKPDSIGIMRHLLLHGGLFEDIEICNYNTHAVSFQLSLSFNADFRDLFEVRQYNERSQRGQPLPARSDKPVIPSTPGQPQRGFLGFRHYLGEIR